MGGIAGLEGYICGKEGGGEDEVGRKWYSVKPR
jgi:hypothetical protein